MKKLLLSLFCFSVLLAACGKGDNSLPCEPVVVNVPSSEVIALQNYITSSGINATADMRGFYYTILKPGSEVTPTPCSDISISYTGRLTSGQQFDASNGITFNLAGLIAGWQLGVPLIGEGGSIILYLPPSLGYGSQAQDNIPANSILVFQVDLRDVM